MEGLRVSKLEEGQQWGKNTSSKDKVQRGGRPPFIGGGKSNRYVLSPHTSGTTAPGPGTTGTHSLRAEPYQAVQPGDQAVVPVEKNNRTNRPATAQPPHRNKRESPLSAVVERYRTGATAWP